MSNILAAILENKRHEIAAAEAKSPLAAVRDLAAKAPPARSFLTALNSTQKPRIIAECKLKSPSRGVMTQVYDPAALAKTYEAGGAAAISVLTDEVYFGGRLEHLVAVRRTVGLPILRKDFILSEYQIYEARAHGADSFLLLSGPLAPAQLEHFLQIGRSLGMEPLVESHTAAELAAALSTSARIIGINNRDLTTFSTDLRGGQSLVEQAQKNRPDATLVCESGIKTRADIESMQKLGYNVFLIGEALVTHPNPRDALRELIA